MESEKIWAMCFLNPADQSLCYAVLAASTTGIPKHLPTPTTNPSPPDPAWSGPEHLSSSLSSVPVTDAVSVCPPAASQHQQHRKSVACSLATGAPTITWPVMVANPVCDCHIYKPFLLLFPNDYLIMDIWILYVT